VVLFVEIGVGLEASLKNAALFLNYWAMVAILGVKE